MLTSTWCLNPDVYACLSNERMVFLDLRHDRYFCLSREQTQKLHALVTPSACITVRSETVPGAAAPASSMTPVASLIKRGILTPCPIEQAGERNAGVITPFSIDGQVKLAQKNLLDGYRLQDTPLKAFDIWNFLASSATAGSLLRHSQIKAIVERVKDRKDPAHPLLGTSQISHANLSRTRHIVSLFYQLRPFWRRDYLCLFDSLALVEFLHRYDLYPAWIFGVTVEPFAAHCWVQDEHFIYNDTCEAVRHYTPIMMV